MSRFLKHRFEGYDKKRIYVWFEAVIGYFSATKAWAINSADEDDWKEFWHKPDAESYYFQGKDNIPFHTVLWPAMLMGYGGLNLPTDVVANEYSESGRSRGSQAAETGLCGSLTISSVTMLILCATTWHRSCLKRRIQTSRGKAFSLQTTMCWSRRLATSYIGR